MSLYLVSDKAAWQDGKNIGDENVSILFTVVIELCWL